MTYAIITGAHFFPYAWFYHARAYAALAAVIPVGSLLLGLRLAGDQLYFIPAFVAACLVLLGGLLLVSYRKNRAAYQQLVPASHTS